jgi:hypothetical protein
MYILKEKSPFYCIFKDSATDEITEIASKILSDQSFEFVRGTEDFQHCRLTNYDCQKLISLSPLRFLSSRCSKPYASIFSTRAGHYYRAHKDGQSIRYAMNYILDAGDEVCETHWYADSVATDYTVNLLGGSSRELEMFQPHRHCPLETVIFQNNQAVLINTDWYHDFDNRKNTKSRHVLTLRFSVPQDYYFEQALGEIKKHANG